MNKAQLERRTRKVAKYHLVLFLFPILSLVYYGWWSSETLNQRPDNPQSAASLAQRGRILDRNGKALAETLKRERVYPLGPAAGNLIGYQLRGKNRSGLESSLRNQLSPVRPPKTLLGSLETDRQNIHQLGLIRRGPDLTTTIDSELQSMFYKRLQKYVGAFVLADGKGAVLAAVTSPSLNPDTIAVDWQELQDNPDGPFIERVGHGLYPVALEGGENLLPNDHPLFSKWTSENPFPNFPGASPAVEIEGRLLVTPLMLLQIALNGTEPFLLSAESSTARPEGNTTGVPLKMWQSEKEMSTLWIEGRPFKGSPRFLVALGRINTQDEPLGFVLVIESSGDSTVSEIQADFFPSLSAALSR